MDPKVDSVARWRKGSNWPYLAAIIVVIVATFSLVYVGNQSKRAAASRIAEANKQAAEAKALAAAARADAESARAEQEKIKAEYARLEERIAVIEQSHSRLLAQNAEAQKKLTQLDEAAQPRTISASQEAKIADSLKPFAGQEVEIRVLSQGYEARRLGERVSACLAKAGLKPSITLIMGEAGQGFAVAVHDAQSTPRLATAMQRAFRSAGLRLDGSVLPDQVTEGKFFIFIGERIVKR
jgi:flagellar biosynthesis GTPase FlhF